VGADGGSRAGVCWSPPAVDGPRLDEGLPSAAIAASPPLVVIGASPTAGEDLSALPPGGFRFVMSNADWVVELVRRRRAGDSTSPRSH
jgi:hypothetical protein